ncbi:hypothetical protein [Pseudomonas sp. LB1P83]
MDFEPLKIEEAIDGVIKMASVEKGGTAIISCWPDASPGDEVDIHIKKEVVCTYKLTGEEVKKIVVIVPKESFLNYSGQGKVPFMYTVYPGGGGNGFESKLASYEIHLA